MTGAWKLLVQQVFSRFGLQIRRLNRGVNLEAAFTEQKRFVDPDAKTIFEVGASDGRDCQEYAVQYPNAKIFAFEPVPASFHAIQKRAKEYPSIHPFNEAMADEIGSAQFHISDWTDASSLLKPKKTGSTFDAYTASSSSILVKVNTIDNFCEMNGINRIDLLKMDAQGAELKILEGSKKCFERKLIRVIYTEVLFLEIYAGAARFDQIMSFLINYGFRFHSLYNLNHNQNGELAHADAIFVQESAL